MNLDWKFFERQFPLAVGSLKNARSSGRLTHAFLLCSANAEYRTAFPPLLASLAACEHPNPDFSPCGRCPVCRGLEKMADTILRWEPAPSADGNIKFFWKKLLYR